MTDTAKIPVTVIGGFLGAGKTTWVNHLLRTSDKRIAVLVNDFGAVNIDAALIARHDGATMTLSNGCVCCSISSGFFDTLTRVVDSHPPFDHIVIEASGVGEPRRIAEIALVEPSLVLHRTIVLADASRIVDLLADVRVGETVRSHFAHCDAVLLNKCDLVDEGSLKRARAAIAEFRGDVQLIATSQDVLPTLGELDLPALPSQFLAESAENKTIDHEVNYHRWLYQRAGAFNRERLAVALERLPRALLRLKGACPIAGERQAQVLQMVGGTWTLAPGEPDGLLPDGIALVGVGTADLPAASELDAILDGALAFSWRPGVSGNVTRD